MVVCGRACAGVVCGLDIAEIDQIIAVGWLSAWRPTGHSSQACLTGVCPRATRPFPPDSSRQCRNTPLSSKVPRWPVGRAGDVCGGVAGIRGDAPKQLSLRNLAKVSQDDDGLGGRADGRGLLCTYNGNEWQRSGWFGGRGCGYSCMSGNWGGRGGVFRGRQGRVMHGLRQCGWSWRCAVYKAAANSPCSSSNNSRGDVNAS